MSTATERPDSADEIEILLQRAAPGAVERDEIVAETGQTTDAIRDGLDHLLEEGEVEETGDGYFRIAEPAAADLSTLGVADDEESPAPALADDTEAPGPALGAQIRTRFEVTCSFGRAPGESDNAALQKTQAIAGEIGNALAAAFPRLRFHVEVKGVDAYDSPRALFPPPDDDDIG